MIQNSEEISNEVSLITLVESFTISFILDKIASHYLPNYLSDNSLLTSSGDM